LTYQNNDPDLELIISVNRKYKKGGEKMLKRCERCGKRLPLIYLIKSECLCVECRAKEKLEQEALKKLLLQLEQELIEIKEITPTQEEQLKTLDSYSALALYNQLFNIYEANHELSEEEIQVLKKIQKICGLSNKEVDFNGRIAPYIYLYCIREENKLPEVDLNIEGGGRIVMKRGESIHFAIRASLSEMRSVSLGYKGGSHGISIPIYKGIRYRLGSHKGQLVKEDRLVEISSGVIIITNKRILLHPDQGRKPYTLPLGKVSFYQCYESGIEIFRAGRQKGLYFNVGSSAVDIIELCFGFLLNND